MCGLIGKKLRISGMTIEVIAEEDESWVTRNITTREVVNFKKDILQKAIKPGKAEEILEPDAK